MMAIEEFDHFTVRTADLDDALRFYGEILGLRCVPRTDLPMRAAIVYFGEGDAWLVHIAEASAEERAAYSMSDTLGRSTGPLLHVATNAHGLADMKKRLESHDWPYRERSLEARSLRQIHVVDPDGVEIEINFPLSEMTGAW
jgi:catechol 2,3-dioxygenase-like lactoylglutathione lyase family enzyme